MLENSRTPCLFVHFTKGRVSVFDVQETNHVANTENFAIMKEKPGKGGESYSPDYLKNVHTQLSCIFNHAIKYYGLQIDPAAKAGNMGSEQPKEILYWCGIREGELLALPPRTQPEGRRLFPHRRAPQRLPRLRRQNTRGAVRSPSKIQRHSRFLIDPIQYLNNKRNEEQNDEKTHIIPVADPLHGCDAFAHGSVC